MPVCLVHWLDSGLLLHCAGALTLEGSPKLKICVYLYLEGSQRINFHSASLSMKTTSLFIHSGPQEPGTTFIQECKLPFASVELPLNHSSGHGSVYPKHLVSVIFCAILDHDLSVSFTDFPITEWKTGPWWDGTMWWVSASFLGLWHLIITLCLPTISWHLI